jgi:hypothetical protein
VVTSKDYYTEICEPLAGVDENRAVPLDWLRFWWDFVSEESAVEFSDCIDILDLANPRSWNTTGDVQDSCSSLTDACNPADRLTGTITSTTATGASLAVDARSWGAQHGGHGHDLRSPLRMSRR